MTDLHALPAAALAALVRTRAISAVEATRAALARMDAVNPALNAVVDPLHDSALAEAEAVDALVAEGLDPGPLAGVPVTVKVNVDCKGRATTNGLRLQKDLIAEHDNPVVANLRRAGAVVIGRTNTPAFSLRWFCRNSLHGDTLNPHDRGLTPGGSSGGASSAVAAGIGAVAHGTDIAGSVRYPAYACNLHGLRPTFGRIPAANFTTPDRYAGGQLCAVSGPLARSIEDVRLSLIAMAAEDPRDPWWMPVPLTLPPLPRRVALCIAPDGMPVAPEVADALRAAARVLEDAGWEVDEIDTPPLAEAAVLNMTLWMDEFARGGAAMLDPEDDPDARFVVEQMHRVTPPGDPIKAMQARITLLRAWQIFMLDHPLVLTPVSGETPFAAHSDVKSPEDFERIFTAQRVQVGMPALGLPGLTVATGRPGAPMGVQLTGPRFREDLLLEAGAVIEAAHPPVAPVDPFVRG